MTRRAILASYLETHHHEMANGHTTLLLSCYTKLKDVTKLDAFIHVDSGVSCEDYVRRFDIEPSRSAVRVLRSRPHVAEHAGETSWYLSASRTARGRGRLNYLRT